jgi:hypothetical protein
MGAFRRLTLLFRLIFGNLSAFGRLALSMPVERALAREKVSARFAKFNFDRVRLHPIAVPGETAPAA